MGCPGPLSRGGLRLFFFFLFFERRRRGGVVAVIDLDLGDESRCSLGLFYFVSFSSFRPRRGR